MCDKIKLSTCIGLETKNAKDNEIWLGISRFVITRLTVKRQLRPQWNF